MIVTETAQGKLFPVIPSAFLAEILDEGLRLVGKHPKILRMIESDQDLKALEKKKARLEEKAWRARQTPAFEGFKGMDDIRVEATTLKIGRPRMSPVTAFLFLLVSEHIQSIYGKAAVDRLLDSRTVEGFLLMRGLPMPGLRTIGDNVNAISEGTRAYILKCQIAEIRGEGLDNFLELHGDSTHVAANTAFPTDSFLIRKLLDRVWRDSRKLPRFGLPTFRRHWTETWLDDLKRLDFAISVTKKAKQRKKHYRRYLETAAKLLWHLAEEAMKLDGRVKANGLPPTLRRQLETLWDGILQDLMDCCHLHARCQERMSGNGKRLGKSRVLSLADRAAAWIQKGGREAVVGYKPQVARSRNGFVTALIVPEGNAADSEMAVKLVDEAIAKTCVRPAAVSFDDGYPSVTNLAEFQKRGIDLVSFSGAKGKKLVGEALWEEDCMKLLRCQRSSVESTMFVLKHNHGFGQVRRRGIDAVREELLAKVILHNFGRIIELRKRRDEKEAPSVAA